MLMIPVYKTSFAMILNTVVRFSIIEMSLVFIFHTFGFHLQAFKKRKDTQTHLMQNSNLIYNREDNFLSFVFNKSVKKKIPAHNKLITELLKSINVVTIIIRTIIYVINNNVKIFASILKFDVRAFYKDIVMFQITLFQNSYSANVKCNWTITLKRKSLFQIMFK